MNIVRKKMRSEKGASITFALLLFLVCAVLSSIIVVAASTASGRMASIAEIDQRYYSVTSASELLKDMIDGKSASVVVVTETDENGTRKTEYIFDKPAYEVTDGDLVEANEKKSVFANIRQAAVYTYYKNRPTGTNTASIGNFALTSGFKEDEIDPLGVTINGVIDREGNIILYIMKNVEDKSFRLKQFFSATESRGDPAVTPEEGRSIDATTLTWAISGLSIPLTDVEGQ